MKYRILDYIFRVWLTSIIAGPVALAIYALLEGGKAGPGDFQVFFIIILFGSLLSLPSLAIFYLICKFLIPNSDNLILLKFLLSISGALLTYLPFLIINDYHPLLNVDQLSRPLFIAYGSMIIMGIWLHKLKPVSSSSVDQPEIV